MPCAPETFRRVALAIALACCGAIPQAASAETIKIPQSSPDDPITIEADYASQWQEGRREVRLLQGHCVISQGRIRAAGRNAVIWIEREGDFGDARHFVTVYLDGDVSVRGPGTRLTDQTYWGQFVSISPVDVRCGEVRKQKATDSPLYRRAIDRRDARPEGEIQRTQYEYESGPEILPETPPQAPPPADTRRLRIFPRGDQRFNVESFQTGRGDETVTIITQGVSAIIDGVDVSQVDATGSVDFSTDRMVIWTTGALDLQGEDAASGSRPVEIYMEGNIIVRQGERVIYADQMYYNVNLQNGIVLDAELLTPVPEFAGRLRLKADVIRQLSRDRFYAHDAFLTTSLMGKPGYRLQSGDIYLQDHQIPAFEPFTGQAVLDPATGEQIIEHQRWATAWHNAVFVGDVPIFYWPVFSADVTDPDLYIRRVQYKNDLVFGTSILTDWDLYDLLGIQNRPRGTDLNLSLDYMSLRGPAGGVAFQYDRPDLFGFPGRAFGFIDSWFIAEQGTDILGSDRMNLAPESDPRGRVFARHRQVLPNDLQLTGEFSFISDRNFLEQYYENEWDEFKDQETAVELKQIRENRSWSVLGAARVNDFFTQTEWLPRADHFWLGQSLLGDRVTWFEHSSVGYGRLETLSTPTNPAEVAKFKLLPWEAQVDGVRAVTAHELDAPFNLGPVKVVPYALGQLAYWGDDLTGSERDRIYFQTGIRASMPFVSVNPDVEDSLFNVHGLAHKVVIDVDAYVAQASDSVTTLPLYDPLDDDVVEHFRRRFAFNTFGGTTPPQFDERFYAIRAGLPSNVTTPSAEVADDMQAIRMGVRQRWQTKRGMPGARRVIDWIVLDTEAVYFPNSGRDNFGEHLGLMGYDFRWHVGDRLTILSDGGLDLFAQGQEILTIGGYLTRPPRGSIYAGFRWLEGPINSKVLSASYNYQLSPKWYSSLGTSVDLGPSGNIGQSVALTRIGESFLVTFGFVADSSKNNVGVSLGIQPRFLPQAKFGAVGIGAVPLAGINGVE